VLAVDRAPASPRWIGRRAPSFRSLRAVADDEVELLR
jgi:hypothetical protein